MENGRIIRSFTEKLYKDATVSDEGKTADEGNDRTDVSDGCETEDKK